MRIFHQIGLFWSQIKICYQYQNKLKNKIIQFIKCLVFRKIKFNILKYFLSITQSRSYMRATAFFARPRKKSKSAEQSELVLFRY